MSCNISSLFNDFRNWLLFLYPQGSIQGLRGNADHPKIQITGNLILKSDPIF